jgi:hypothetical protein
VVLAGAVVLLTPLTVVDRLAGAARVRELLRPLELVVSESAPARANLLISAVYLDYFFGGQICIFNLARRLAEHGLRVRIVTTDPQPKLPASWRRQLEAYEGLDGALEQVEFAFAGDRPPLEVSPRDGLVATTSWTALVANEARSALGRPRFVHLIQEYDALAFPNGSMAALARKAYRLPHHAIFSTELLRDYFRRHRLGVFEHEDDDPPVVRNAITPTGPATREELAARAPTLVFYARPEPHASRNMFELGVAALTEAVAEGVFGPDWSFLGVGSVRPLSPVVLSDGRRLDLLPRRIQRAYAETLRRGTVGLALMDTPHPSLAPIEMAAAGLAVVTSTFENKDQAALQAISPNLIGAEPTLDGVVGALRAAVARTADADALARGSDIDWPTSWDDAWHDRLVEHVAAWL